MSSNVNKEFDFLKHCKNCPRSSVHCCTKPNNIVLARDNEKNHLQTQFDRLNREGLINLPDYELFDNQNSKDGVTPINLLTIESTDNFGKKVELKQCPFFKDPICLIHNEGKPTDCQLWPVSRFENSNKEKIFIDRQCSAVNAEEPIPLVEIEKDIDILKGCSDEEKAVLYDQNSNHYSIEAIPIKYWSDFQELKGKYKPLKDSIEKDIEKQFSIFRKSYVKLEFNTEQVLLISKWVIGIFFILMLEALLNQVTFNVSVQNFSDKPFLDFFSAYIQNGFLANVVRVSVITFLALMFVLDFYRLIVPLPWVVKEYNKLENIPTRIGSFTRNNLPRLQVYKLLGIGVVSFILLNMIAIRFLFEPIYYLFIYGGVIFLDVLWYIIKSNDVTKKMEDSYRKLVNDTNKKFEGLIKQTETNQNDLLRNAMRDNQNAFNDLATYFENDIDDLKKLKDGKLYRLKELADLSKDCEMTISTIEKDIRNERKFVFLAYFDLIICLVLTPLLVFLHYKQVVYTYQEFLLQEKFIWYQSFELYLIGLILLHVWAIWEDLFKVNKFYIDYLRYFYLRDNSDD